MRFTGACQRLARWCGCEQRSGHAHQHQHRHDGIDYRPTTHGVGEVQRSCASHNKTEAVASLRHRRPRALLRRIKYLDAVSVDHDILAGGKKCHRQRECRSTKRPRGRIAESQANNRTHESQLDHQHPTAPPPEAPRQQRHGYAVDQRCPQKLQRIRCARQRKQTDRRQRHAHFRQPNLQSAHRQQQGQAAGKAHDKNKQQTPFGVELERIQRT